VPCVERESPAAAPGFSFDSCKVSLSTIRPSVPDIRPAAIESLWQNGKLALPDMPSVRQFPKWRAFVRDAADRKLTNQQIAGVPHRYRINH
jgi:hypothetical protein